MVKWKALLLISLIAVAVFVTGLYKNTPPKAMGRLDQLELRLTSESGKDAAIRRVAEFPEVKNWLEQLSDPLNRNPQTISRPVVEFDHMDGNKYVVHVYELVKDTGNSAHSATFNWFIFDPISSSVDLYDLSN